LNGRVGKARLLPLKGRKPQKRYEALGDWMIELYANEDEDASSKPLIVESEHSAPPDTEPLEGAPTVIARQPEVDDSQSRTRRSSQATAAPNAHVASFATLVYEDDTGQHTFHMHKDVIKIGRGGPDEWVDLKLLTTKDVSREHCQIRRDPGSGKFFIKDLSKFGTWVNSKRVPPSITVENGVEHDSGQESPLPQKADINIADTLAIQFRAAGARRFGLF
jgi:pSer/pThr/pTyr-binding forkhead associated (FHA) protein